MSTVRSTEAASDILICVFQEVIRFPHTVPAIGTAVATCVFCVLGSCSAILGNTLVLTAFSRTRELHTLSNFFLISLMCTDLLVGSVVEPLFIVRQALSLSGKEVCSVWIAYLTMALFCTGASFLNLALISCERYIAIFSPLHYARRVTKPRVIAAIGGLWTAWILLTCVRFVGVSNKVIYMTVFAIIGSCYVGTVFIYVRIFREARRHQRIIANQHSCDASNTARETKLAKTVGFIFSALLICYTPGMIILLIRSIKGDSATLLYVAYPWAESLIFMSSTLNPLIYCWRNRDIRRAVFRIVSPFKNRVSPSVVSNASAMNNIAAEPRSQTPKTDYGTYVFARTEVVRRPPEARDIEVESICSKDDVSGRQPSEAGENRNKKGCSLKRGN